MDYKARKEELKKEALQIQQKMGQLQGQLNQMASRLNAIGGQQQLLDELDQESTPADPTTPPV